MTAYLLVKYFHYLSIIGMSGLLLAELIMVKKQMSRKSIAALAGVDAWYGVFALLVVGIGLTLWFGVGKGAEFYDNPVLHVKVGLVVIIGILSIWPTVFFIRNRKGDPTDVVNIPAHIRNIIAAEIILLAIVPYLAVMMAHGLRF